MGQAPRDLAPTRSGMHFFGAELRHWRVLRGLSQDELGRLTHDSGSAIGKVEKAVRRPSLRLARECDQALNTGGVLQRLWPLVEKELGRKGDPDSQADTATADTGRAASVLDDRANRTHDGRAQPSSLGEAIWADAVESARYARHLTGATIHPIALDDIHAQIRWLARCYVSRPLVELLDQIRQLRAQVFFHLDGGHEYRQYRDLHMAAGRLTGLLAHAALDCGDYASADVHARTAWLFAEYADHHGTRAWVRSLQSLIAYWDSRPREAVEFARDGIRFVSPDANEVRLRSLEARACAALHDHDGALDALTAAESCGERPDDTEGVGGVFTFPPAKRAAYAGTTLLALGGREHVEHAVTESTRALTTYAALAAGDRSTGDMLAARMDLVRAHVAQRHLDAAHTQFMQVTAVPPHRRTASIVRRVLVFTHEFAQTPDAASSLGGDMVEAGRSFQLTAPALRPR